MSGLGGMGGQGRGPPDARSMTTSVGGRGTKSLCVTSSMGRMGIFCRFSLS